MISTFEGTRCLDGLELRVFMKGLGWVFNQLTLNLDMLDLSLCPEDNDLSCYEMPDPFNKMDHEDKIISLATIARAVLDKEGSALEPFAWSEATLCACYKGLETALTIEIESTQTFDLSKLVAEASEKIIGHLMDHIPECKVSFDEGDLNKWQIVINLLRDRMSSEDWKDCNIIEDFPPDMAKEIKFNMAIPDNYFSEPNPSGDKKKLEEDLLYLLELTKRY